MSEQESGSYQVLARKYRPGRFDDLIGQEPMIRTLRNAFASGRIPHAWMLTGVRGVGKTTTARILARALNFELSDGTGTPTVDLPEEGGVHCKAILEGRHPDVVEMDAASHTGIDDIRDIIESARYMPVSARTKVYIIDEVHMLSKAAFNGLLKTLEEPPDHVKFVFATTEIRKVPVTVLSRCQRFDLHRIDSDLLVRHLARIAELEQIKADDDALMMITRAAEGSVRDALSILDQAIAHGDGTVKSDALQGMLGLADRTTTIDLFEAVMKGEIGEAIALLEAQYQAGAEPVSALSDLADFCHFVTRSKLAPEAVKRAAVPQEEIERASKLAEALSVRILSRTWQILLKGLTEIQQSTMPLAAAEMVLVRLCHAADMPTPGEILEKLQKREPTSRDAGQETPKDSGPGQLSGSKARNLSPVSEKHQDTAPTGAPISSPGRPPTARSSIAERSQTSAAVDYDFDDHHRAIAESLVEPDTRSQDSDEVGSELRTYPDIVELAKSKRDRLLVYALERQVRPVRVDPQGRLEIGLTDDASSDLAQRLGQALTEWTGRRWIIIVAKDVDGETIHDTRVAERTAEIEAARSEPIVDKILEVFEGAEIVGVKALPTKVDDAK